MINRHLTMIGNSAIGIAVALLLFLMVNLISTELFSTYRIDLTENRIYTLSSGARNIVSDLNDSIKLDFYVSSSGLQEYPALRLYASRVEDFLREFERLSNGKVAVNVIEPEPFSEHEDSAVGYGLDGLPGGDGYPTYLGLVGTNSVHDSQVIAFFYPEREELLEYDVTRLIYKLDEREVKTVGVITSLPIQGGAGLIPGSSGQMPPWNIFIQMSEIFDLRVLSASDDKLPEDLDALILIHPVGYSEDLLYAIDQYALSGNGLLVLTDPYSEVMAAILENVPQMPASSIGSQLNHLTENWGVTTDTQIIVGDLPIAARVLEGDGSSGRTVDYPVWMNVQPLQLNSDDVITADLGNLIFATAGTLAAEHQSGLVIEPLIWSSRSAKLYETDQIANLTKVRDLLADYREEDKQYPLAVRVHGDVTSAFADKLQTASNNFEHTDSDTAHRHSDFGQINAVIIADTDFLHDRFWTRTELVLGRRVVYAEASNGELFHAVIDNLTGGSDLISVKSRGSSLRPFERIAKIRQSAEQEYLEQENRLLEELDRINTLLVDYSQTQSESSGSVILTEEQKNQIKSMRDNQLTIRKDLREVRRKLNSDIERVQNAVTAINLLAIPGLVAVIGIFMITIGARNRQKRLVRAVSDIVKAQ